MESSTAGVAKNPIIKSIGPGIMQDKVLALKFEVAFILPASIKPICRQFIDH